MSETRLPNFCIIGAAKSATTSLHEYLKQHPDIFMSSRKEPNFFAFRGQTPSFRGPDDEDPGRYVGLEQRLRVAKYEESVTTDEEYARLFKRAEGEPAIGESSVSYMYVSESAERIREAIPDVKIIAILRNPIDRAFSKFLQFRKDGLEPIADFGEAIDAEEGRVRQNWSPTWYYKGRGMYYEQIKRFYDRFDRSQIHILNYDDFTENPLAELQRIFQFLGVTQTFVPDVGKRHNVSRRRMRTPRSQLVNRLLNEPNRLRKVARRVLNKPLRNWLKRFATRRNTKSVRWSPPAMAPDVRAQLVEEFRDDVLSLEELIGRDFSSWLEIPNRESVSV